MTDREAISILERRLAHLEDRIQEARRGFHYDRAERAALRKAITALEELEGD